MDCETGWRRRDGFAWFWTVVVHIWIEHHGRNLLEGKRYPRYSSEVHKRCPERKKTQTKGNSIQETTSLYQSTHVPTVILEYIVSRYRCQFITQKHKVPEDSYQSVLRTLWCKATIQADKHLGFHLQTCSYWSYPGMHVLLSSNIGQSLEVLKRKGLKIESVQ